jgi:hypothetical protein
LKQGLDDEAEPVIAQRQTPVPHTQAKLRSTGERDAAQLDERTLQKSIIMKEN